MIITDLDGIHLFCYGVSAIYTAIEIVFILVLFWPDICSYLTNRIKRCKMN
jgi:hypothetical protein